MTSTTTDSELEPVEGEARRGIILRGSPWSNEAEIGPDSFSDRSYSPSRPRRGTFAFIAFESSVAFFSDDDTSITTQSFDPDISLRELLSQAFFLS